MNDLRTGQPCRKIECYKCQSTHALLVEEKLHPDSGEIIEKNFICAPCAGGFEKIFEKKLKEEKKGWEL